MLWQPGLSNHANWPTTEPTQHVVTIDCGCWEHSYSKQAASAFSSPEALAFLLHQPLMDDSRNQRQNHLPECAPNSAQITKSHEKHCIYSVILVFANSFGCLLLSLNVPFVERQWNVGGTWLERNLVVVRENS